MSELYHFGILGMHWGVRRYRNKDGTLTEAGKQRYIKKMTKYRDKMVRRANWRNVSSQMAADRAGAKATDLKENGYSSETYKQFMKDRYEERKSEYENRKRYYNEATGNWEPYYKYEGSIEMWVDTGADLMNSKKLLNQEIDKYTKLQADNIATAKQWAKNSRTLQKMEISELTTKAEIKEKYRKGH